MQVINVIIVPNFAGIDPVNTQLLTYLRATYEEQTKLIQLQQNHFTTKLH